MSKRKLLLADDSVTIQKVVNLTFADEGIDVTAVGDGNAAMEKFVESTPDLVMVDVNMPGVDGYKICEIIKQDEETKHIPVILLVGSFEPFDEEEALRVGADDYLTKPFQSIRQLVGKVTALLDAADGKTISSENAAAFAVNTDSEATSDNSNEEVISHPALTSAATLWGATDDALQAAQIGSLPVDETLKFSSDFSSEEILQTPDQPATNEVETEQKEWSKTPSSDAAELTEIHSIDGVQPPDTKSADQSVYEFAEEPSLNENLNIDSESSGQKDSDEPKSSGQIPADDSADESKKVTSDNSSNAETDESDLLEVPFLEEDEFYDFEDETIEEVKLTSDETADAATESGETDISDIENSYAVSAIQPEPGVYAQSSETENGTILPEVSQSENLQSDYSQTENSQSDYLQPGNAQPEYSQPIDASPEFIDAIASKVAEKLSDTLVREIAREVAARTADLIIQKMMQDK